MDLKVNWDHKRAKHAIERMWLRGVSIREIEEALVRGKKSFQLKTRLTQSLFKRLIVIYDERVYKDSDLRKVFPVTVKIV